MGNFSYQEALKDTEAGIVNVLSSTSGLFTLICAAIYPSSNTDRFTLSKLSAVLLRSDLAGSFPVHMYWTLMLLSDLFCNLKHR